MDDKDAAGWRRVGKAIADRISELKLTDAEVRRRGGPSDKTLKGWVAGKPIVRDDVARGLCDALGWSKDSIDRIRQGHDPIVLETVNVYEQMNPNIALYREVAEMRDEVGELRAAVGDLRLLIVDALQGLADEATLSPHAAALLELQLQIAKYSGGGTAGGVTRLGAADFSDGDFVTAAEGGDPVNPGRRRTTRPSPEPEPEDA